MENQEQTNRDIYENYFKQVEEKGSKTAVKPKDKKEFIKDAVYFLVNKSGTYFACTGHGVVIEETKNFRDIDAAINHFQVQVEVRDQINKYKGNLIIIRDPEDPRILDVFKAIHTTITVKEELFNSKSNLNQIQELLGIYFNLYPSMNFIQGLMSLGLIQPQDKLTNKEVVELLKKSVKLKGKI